MHLSIIQELVGDSIVPPSVHIQYESLNLYMSPINVETLLSLKITFLKSFDMLVFSFNSYGVSNLTIISSYKPVVLLYFSIV